MKVKELREVLEWLAERRAVDEVLQLAALIEPLDPVEVDDLFKLLVPAITKGAKAEAAKVERARRAAEKARHATALSETAVARYVAELEQAKSDNATFEEVARRIEKDRTIKIAQVQEIARRFTSSAVKHKTKKAAMKAVLQRQIADQRSAARSSQVSDLF